MATEEPQAMEPQAMEPQAMEPQAMESQAMETQAMETQEVPDPRGLTKTSVHFGDADFDDLNTDDIGEASWKEVFTMCCVHTPLEWGKIFLTLCGLCFCLYFFILSLELLGTGAKVLTGCAAGSLFGDNTNPIAALMVGILVTVLLQSSSTTTSIIVSLVGSGAITVEPAIYMIMGANIGTSVTNTIVAMGQMGDGAQLERAFAGATVHDMFNYCSVAVLLPLEAATHYLLVLTGACVKNFQPKEGAGKKGKGIKVIIKPILDRIIIANKKVVNEIASGEVENCNAYYPVECAGGVESYQACNKDGRIGTISCNKNDGTCPLFFQNGATESDDKASGGVSLFLGIVMLIICLVGLVSLLQKMLLGASTRIIYKATNINGYISMIVGAIITALVQSSSITTSVLTPLVGVGVIQLEQMLPLTLGANIGTTVTALMAAAVADTSTALQVALAHFFFNISGIVIWYPVPFMRRVPLNAARGLGKATRWWRGFPLVYIGVMFFLLPVIFLGISSLFTMGSAGYTALGAIIVCIIALALLKFAYWWRFKNGRVETQQKFEKRQIRADMMKTLPEDIAWMKDELARLKDHVGLPDEEAMEENNEKLELDDTEKLDAEEESSDN